MRSWGKAVFWTVLIAAIYGGLMFASHKLFQSYNPIRCISSLISITLPESENFPWDSTAFSQVAAVPEPVYIAKPYGQARQALDDHMVELGYDEATQTPEQYIYSNGRKEIIINIKNNTVYALWTFEGDVSGVF